MRKPDPLPNEMIVFFRINSSVGRVHLPCECGKVKTRGRFLGEPMCEKCFAKLLDKAKEDQDA